MKKLRLLMAFCTLFLIGGGNFASAQASYNHTYTEGVTVAAGSDYFLYNIGAGQFLTAGLNYGTRATVDNSGRVLTLAVNGTGYSIYTNYVSLNNRTDAKAGYLTKNGYVDTKNNDAAWVFTPVNLAGYTNAYTIKNSDTEFLFFDKDNTDPGCPVNVGENPGNNYSLWLLIPKSAREDAGDYSHYLINTQMNSAWEFKTWGGSTAWDDKAIYTPGGLVSNRCGEKYHAATDVYQEVKETLPNGRYRISAQGFWRQDGSDAGAYLYANDDKAVLAELNAHSEGTAESMDGASTSFNAGLYVNSVETFVSNGSLRTGIKVESSTQWVIFDNFVLDYLGQMVKDYAVALPAGGAMEADTWYYFDIAAAADNYNATATTLGDIICTDDGNTLTSAATGNVTLTATDNSFAAKRYYVKSSSANNLKIGVASYSYSVSEASVDKTYIQPSQTVTVSFTASTNDPGATLTQNYSGVTFDGKQIDITPGDKGFTFTVPANLTANTEYTLAIPAEAIGYAAGSTYNAAQNITLNTPAVFDGIYYLKAAATYDGSSEGTSAAVGKYLARGLNYGTHATLDKYGLPVQITTNANNETTIQAYDTKRYFFHGNTYDCYADQGTLAATSYFTVTLNNGKLLIHNNSMAAGTYLKYNTTAASDANIAVFDDGTGNNAGPIIMWTTENASAHATAMQSYKDAQAATAAAAAYASGNYASLNGITTVSALEEELEAHYIKGDFVSPSSIESVSEKYEGGQPGSDNITETVYSNSINITEPGFYKFSMQAFYRAASNDVTQNMHTNSVDFPPVTLFFGNSETQIKSVYDEGNAEQIVKGWGDVTYEGQHYPNNMDASLEMFKADKYHNDVYFYASEPGEYTYGVKYMGFANANAQWFIYSPESVEITSYAAAADAADYTALQNAINAYDAATWGFETDEYAPYNNVEAINNIAAAKAIDKGAENSKLLVNSLTTKLALTANAGEVNAFCGGNFTQYETVSGEDMPYGWNLYNGASNHSRIMGGTEGSSNTGLAATTSGKALLLKFNATYGESEGYTMPLKGGKLYKITFKHGRWAENNPRKTNVIMTDPNGTSITLAPGFQATNNDCQSNKSNWEDFTGYFIATIDGNYKFNFEKELKSGQNTQMQIAIGDIELKSSTDALEFADNSAVPAYAPGTYPTVKITRSLTANRWATAVYPFAVSDVDNIAVLDSYDKATGTIGFTTATESEANVPFLMRSTAGTTEISLSDVEVAATVANPVATKSEASLKGAYTTTNITNAEKNYVLSNNEIFSVGTAGATINPYRAYIQLSGAGAARAIRFVVDGQITGVDNVKAASETEVKDGKYLENGKIVIVKNGVKYNAAGAKLY